MTLPELSAFLDQGEEGVRGRPRKAPDAALARGDALLGRGRPADAAAAYRDALRLAPPGSPERVLAIRSLASALLTGGNWQPCAETAAAAAPTMAREPAFVRVVHTGLSCAGQGGAAPWAEAARKILVPLALEAVALPTALRDDRFQIYQELMDDAKRRDDTVALVRWGARWLGEIEATTPASDDERTALDIARVDAVSLLGTPERALAALVASERAMPANYNASLRLAQTATAARRYDDAVAVCDRGLAHASGPIGRTWLLETKAEALAGRGDVAAARRVLEEALRSARAIGSVHVRDHNVRRITRALAEKGNGK